MLKPPNKLCVNTSNISGRGVYALEDIKKGEILEECHFVELNEKEFKNIDSILKEYVFCFPIDNDKSNCIVLGFGMIYNHNILNNAYWETDIDKNCYRFIANKDIKKGEEIFINYQKSINF